MLSAPRVMLPHLQQQQPQAQQGQPGQQQQQHAIPPPPPPVQVTNPQDLSLAGVLHFLQTEWRRYERERNEWEIERAEMRVCLQKEPRLSFKRPCPSRPELPSSRASDALSKM
jgi:striatin 1/3/4